MANSSFTPFLNPLAEAKTQFLLPAMWGTKDPAAPPFLGRTAEEVQKNLSLLALVWQRRSWPALKPLPSAETELTSSTSVMVTAHHLRGWHHPNTDKMGRSGCRALPGQGWDFSAGYFYGIQAVQRMGGRTAKILQERTTVTSYLHPSCIA